LSILTNSHFKGKILRNKDLANYTSFKIGGKADYFIIPNSWNDLLLILEEIKKFKFPYKIMGRGSNILISDEGVEGAVIKIDRSLGNIMLIDDTFIKVEAGCLISEFLRFLYENNLGGLEFLAGIPGTIGGAVFCNAGAFGEAIGDYIEEIVIIDENLKERIIKRNDMNFSYRNSGLKDKWIIKSIIIKVNFQKGEITYKKILEILKERRQKLPNLPSAGSIFKNPPNFSAGYLLDNLGMKGKRVGNVMVSYEHANIIVNLGGGKAKEVKELISMMRDKVKDVYNISLELEIKIW
jgi:UDP-N-acetylmuramate dehydrogenase